LRLFEICDCRQRIGAILYLSGGKTGTAEDNGKPPIKEGIRTFMITEEKNEEMSRQFEQIYQENQDPEIVARKKRKQKREEDLKNKTEDYGI